MLNKNSVNFSYTAQKNLFLKYNLRDKSDKTRPIIKKVDSLTLHKELNKNEIKNLKLIGQFDKKFIITFNNNHNSIIIFDQHAIHERILFEYYSNLLSSKLNPKKIDAIPLQSPSKGLNFSKYNLFSDIYSKIFLTDPLEIKFNSSNYIKYDLELDFTQLNNLFEFEFIITKDVIKLYSVPVIFDKIYQRDVYMNIFLDLLHNLSDILFIKKIGYEIKNDKILLEIFMPIIKSKACRDSVKFNEELDEDFMNSLLKNLSECKNPFLCAHGRHDFFILNDKKSF